VKKPLIGSARHARLVSRAVAFSFFPTLLAVIFSNPNLPLPNDSGIPAMGFRD
jgi:hypothetical protein